MEEMKDLYFTARIPEDIMDIIVKNGYHIECIDHDLQNMPIYSIPEYEEVELRTILSDEKVEYNVVLRQQEGISPITAKAWMMKNWNNYGLTEIKSEKEFRGLLNMLQAYDLTLEDMHNAVFNGHTHFMHFLNFSGWDTMDELYDAILSYNAFYTEEEFMNYILDRLKDMKEDGYEDPVEEIKAWTYSDSGYEGHPTDTDIKKTEDGYVVIVHY